MADEKTEDKKEDKKEENEAPAKEPSPKVEADRDWEAEYNQLSETLNQVAAERENYKKVALAKKGRSVPDETGETEEDRVRRLVAEQLELSKETEASRQKDVIVKQALRENKELKAALKARGQVGTRTAGGSETTHDSPGIPFWTEEQTAYFKKRGIDPNMVQKNYLRLKEK